MAFCKYRLFSFILILLEKSYISALAPPFIDSSRRLSFEELSEKCQNVETSIEKGPTHVLKNMTDESYYDKKKRPNTAPVSRGEYAGRDATTAPDNVTYSLFLSSVDLVDVKKQEITLSVYEFTRWHDPRLSFDLSKEASCVVGAGSSSFPAISLSDIEINGEFQKIWKPDMYLVNSRGVTTLKEHMVFIFEDGHVIHVQQKTFTASCPMKFGQFPYLSIECELDISTFSQTTDEIILNYNPVWGFSSSSDMIDLNTYINNFNVGSFELNKITKSKSYYEKTQPKQHVIGTLILDHQPGSFWEAVLIPDCILHVAIYSSFWIASTSAPARVTICVIAALTFRVLMSSLYDQIPDVPYELWVIEYMVTSQIIAVIALIQYALVQYFLNTQDSRRYVLTSLQESQVLEILDSGKMTCTELFIAAIEKYNLFKKTSNKVKENDKVKNVSNSSFLCQKNANKTMPLNKRKSEPYDFAISRMKDRGSSISRLEVEVENYFDGKLGITDVMNIIIVRDIFSKFDQNDLGIISISEFQHALRHFGYFYSHLQMCALMEAFWQYHGTLLEHHMSDIDLETFLRVLIGHKQYEPFKDIHTEIMNRKPSIVCDIFARMIYPFLFCARCFIFWCLLSSY